MKTSIERNKEVKEIVEKSKNLRIKEVTENLNGYPRPIIGFGVIGFNSFDEICDFQEKYGGEIVSFYWKDGWSLINIHEYINEEYDILKFTYEDEIDPIYTNERDLIDDVTRYLTGNFKYEEDEIAYLIEEWKKIVKKIDFKKEFIVVYNIENLSYYTLPYKDISYYHDWKNYEIGIFFKY